MTAHPVWGQAVSPRSGRCVSGPPSGSWAGLSQRRRGEGHVVSPAASSLAERPALTDEYTGLQTD